MRTVILSLVIWKLGIQKSKSNDDESGDISNVIGVPPVKTMKEKSLVKERRMERYWIALKTRTFRFRLFFSLSTSY